MSYNYTPTMFIAPFINMLINQLQHLGTSGMSCDHCGVSSSSFVASPTRMNPLTQQVAEWAHSHECRTLIDLHMALCSSKLPTMMSSAAACGLSQELTMAVQIWANQAVKRHQQPKPGTPSPIKPRTLFGSAGRSASSGSGSRSICPVASASASLSSGSSRPGACALGSGSRPGGDPVIISDDDDDLYLEQLGLLPLPDPSPPKRKVIVLSSEDDVEEDDIAVPDWVISDEEEDPVDPDAHTPPPAAAPVFAPAPATATAAVTSTGTKKKKKRKKNKKRKLNWR